MEKYGFVYIWFDRKHKRYYVGCHWGKEDDGYICSSSWMKKAYKYRPQDFKRRILSRIYSNKKDLLQEEYNWLSTIKNEELGTRYYNLQNRHFAHWSTDAEKLKTIGEKISKINKGNPILGSHQRGIPLSEEKKLKISVKLKGRKINYIRTKETRKLISDNSKRLQKEKKVGMHGKKHKFETIDKMKTNNAMNNPIHKAKVKASKQGIKWLINGDIRKMAIPGTDKYNDLINQGFKAF
jgi:hypothetical protein